MPAGKGKNADFGNKISYFVKNAEFLSFVN